MSAPTNNWRYKRAEHRFMRKSQRTSQHEIQNVKTYTRTTHKKKKTIKDGQHRPYQKTGGEQ